MKGQRTILLILLIASLTAHVIFGMETQSIIDELEYQNNRKTAQILDRDLEIEIQQILIDMQDDIIQNHIDTREQESEGQEYIGEFEITYYTAGKESTGKSPGHPAYGITRSGTMVEEGRTIATDWDVLPVGSEVYIEGLGYRTVEDTGGLIKGNSIDVYVEDVEVALQGGRHTADVWIVEVK